VPCRFASGQSRKGNPYDNAACESFMKTLKYEEVHRQEYRDLPEARASCPQAKPSWRPFEGITTLSMFSATCKGPHFDQKCDLAVAIPCHVWRRDADTWLVSG